MIIFSGSQRLKKRRKKRSLNFFKQTNLKESLLIHQQLFVVVVLLQYLIFQIHSLKAFFNSFIQDFLYSSNYILYNSSFPHFHSYSPPLLFDPNNIPPTILSLPSYISYKYFMENVWLQTC